MKDILSYLKKEHPKICYYKAVPVQYTLDYLLMQDNISGQFLNGQTLYLKPAFKDNSIDEKESISLDSFEVIKLIGSGGFSKVFLCRYKRTGEFYAMKVIDKEVIVKNKKKNIIMNERNIMKSTSHPFLIEMKFAF
jgi:serine/threonine protein kinase